MRPRVCKFNAQHTCWRDLSLVLVAGSTCRPGWLARGRRMHSSSCSDGRHWPMPVAKHCSRFVCGTQVFHWHKSPCPKQLLSSPTCAKHCQPTLESCSSTVILGDGTNKESRPCKIAHTGDDTEDEGDSGAVKKDRHAAAVAPSALRGIAGDAKRATLHLTLPLADTSLQVRHKYGNRCIASASALQEAAFVPDVREA